MRPIFHKVTKWVVVATPAMVHSTTSMDIKQNVASKSLGKVTDNLSYAPRL